MSKEHKGFVLCIGGLISVGKSTLIQKIIQHANKHNLNLHIMPELLCPSLCERLPVEPLIFDTFLIGHRLQMALDAPHLARLFDAVVMERCHLDHLAFLTALEKEGWASQEHCAWLRKVVDELNPPIPGRVVYLDVAPELAFERMKKRADPRDSLFTLSFFSYLRESYIETLKQHCPDAIILDWTNFGRDIDLGRLFEKPGFDVASNRRVA